MLDPDTFGRAYLKGSNDPISKQSTFSHKRSFNDLLEIDSANGKSQKRKNEKIGNLEKK